MKRMRVAFVAFALLATVGCNEDEVGTNPPVDEAWEAKLAETLPTVTPLIDFMKSVSGRLTIFPTSGTTGLECPDTTDWCAWGNVDCYHDPVDSLDRVFTFDECVAAWADRPLTLNGVVAAIPNGLITIVNLVVDDSPMISGTGRTNTQTCYHEADVQAGGARLQADVVICDADTYPTDGTLHILLSSYQISIQFDGTSTPSALARRNSTGESVAECTIDLVPLTSSCVPV